MKHLTNASSVNSLAGLAYCTLLVACVSVGLGAGEPVQPSAGQLTTDRTGDEWSCEHSSAEATPVTPAAKTSPLRPRVDLDDFEIWQDKALGGYDLAVHGDVASLEDCAQLCVDHPGHVTCRSFMYRPSESSCRLRYDNEFAEGSVAGVTSGISLPRRSYLTIPDKIATGYTVDRLQTSTLERCADLAACGSHASFVYQDGTCELKTGTTLEAGSSPGYVSGIKKSSELRSRKVRALYILPRGQQPKEDAETAIEAILRQVQQHYLVELGVTFELAGDDLVTRVYSPFTTEAAANWHTNKDFVISQLSDAYLAGEDIVVSILQGTGGPAGGSSGITKMTGGFWNTAYGLFEDGKLENSPKLGAWSHELGHAFGLRHLSKPECLKGHGFDLESKPPGVKVTCVMRAIDKLDTLYDIPFVPGERRFLLEPGHSNGHDVFRGVVNGRKRPHPTHYLRQENVQIRTRLGSELKCLTLPKKVFYGTEARLGACAAEGWAWTILPSGHLRSAEDPGKCLSARGHSYAPGTAVQAWKCMPGQTAELWAIDKQARTLRPRSAPDVCVEASGDGAIRLATCDGSAAQRWSFQRPIVLRTALDAQEKTLRLKTRNTVRLYRDKSSLLQRWILSSDGRIHNARLYDRCLQAGNGSYDQKTTVRVATCSTRESSQLWTVDRYLGVIHPREAPAMCVDVSGGKYEDDRKIQLWGCNNSPAQRWLVY